MLLFTFILVEGSYGLSLLPYPIEIINNIDATDQQFLMLVLFKNPFFSIIHLWLHDHCFNKGLCTVFCIVRPQN